MKKLMTFLMITIPLLIILIVNLTINVFLGEVYTPVEKIVLSDESVEVKVDDTIKLSYTIYPENATNKDVIWQSDDESVAVVDDEGNVNFISYGTGYITAISHDGKQASCRYHATDDKVHRVVLSAETNEVALGENLELGVQILPSEALNHDVEYQSSNPLVAQVDSNGRVQGLSIGVATITVTTADGGKTDSIDIFVVKPVEDLVVDQSEIVCATATYQVTFTVLPEDATNKNVKFEIDNSEIAEVDSFGLITFKKAGKFKLTITTLSGNLSREINFIYTAGYANGLSVAQQFISATVGDAPQYVNYQVSPAGVVAPVKFQSEDEGVAYVDRSGYLQFVGGGDTVIHVFVNKSEVENDIIEQKINVHVENPARGIIIDDQIITAIPQVQLSPKSYPDTSTNQAFYFHSLTDGVEVSSEGLVTFASEKVTTAQIMIYANSDNSNVSKVVTIVYTAGKASEFSLVSDSIEIECDQTASISYKIAPSGITSAPQFRLLSSTPNVVGESVVQLMNDGQILAKNGGSAVVEASIMLYDGTEVKQQCRIIVIRNPSQIEIELGLEFYNDSFVTADKAVTLQAQILPRDTSIKQITWTVDDNDKAIISNGQLIFNAVGSVALTASCGQVKSTINVYYTGSYPLSAEVGANFNGNKTQIPSTLNVGDRFDVYLKSIFPSNTENKTISLQTTNETTSATNLPVLTFDGTSVTATAGGKTTLVVYVSNSVRLSFDIVVIKKPESIVVTPFNARVTSDTIELVAQVLPVDAQQEVKFELQETQIATLSENILHFNQNGRVFLRAYCVSDDSIETPFFIEKVDKETVLLSENMTSKVVNVGQTMAFDLLGQSYTSFTLQSSMEEVVKVDGQFLIAASAGQSDVTCALYSGKEKTKEIVVHVSVVALAEQIILKSDLDFQDGEYLIASDKIALDFEVLPSNAANKNLTYSLSSSDMTISQSLAYMNGNTIHFIRPGTVTLAVKSQDGNASLSIRVRYTGGDAVGATLSVEDNIIMDLGQTLTIDVVRWVPKDTINRSITITDISSAINSVISVNSKMRTITALEGGKGKILVELSSGISKEIDISVIRKVSSIQVESEILTAKKVVEIQAQALPTTATNTVLSYQMAFNAIASLDENVLTFLSPGTVQVTIMATDGSGISKTISVTSTFGYYSQLILNASSKTLSKNEVFALYVTQKLPTDASNGEINFKILNSRAADGSNNPVVKLEADGKVTALYGGRATIRVYSLNYSGQEVYADCEIEVFVPVTSIEVNFSRQLDTYQNAFVTAQNEIGFSVSIYPQDASIRTYTCQISDMQTAEISGEKILFKTRNRVTIKFISDDDSQGERAKSYTFYYFGDDLISASIDRSQIDDGKILLNAEQTFTFSISETMPSDNQNLIFSIQNGKERRIDQSKQVATFENGTLFACNGGEFDFTLYLNNILIGNFTLVVTRAASGIEIGGDQQVYTSEPYYQIVATILPSDAKRDDLGYKCSSSSVQISDSGEVSFSSYGVYEVKVYAKSNPKISKTITIEYTKELRGIQFKDSRDKMFVTDYVDLTIITQPYDAPFPEYTIEVDNNQIAELTLRSKDTYRLRGLESGEVTVTATVKGKNISVSKTFTFVEKITGIQLEPDRNDDKNGQGGYRYWGNLFLNGANTINTYQMNATLQPSTATLDLLKWTSNDENVATVDENGLVTFLRDGKVTITVSQQKPYESTYIFLDSYEFIIVNGINVSSIEEFSTAQSKLVELNKPLTENFHALVLHDDLIFNDSHNIKSVTFNYNVYGNGHLINMERVSQKANAFVISRNNIVVDNVTLRGTQIQSGASLSSLDGAAKTLLISNCKNVLIYNSTIENGEDCIYVSNSDVTIAGCIMRNAFTSGVYIRTFDPAKYCTVKVKDSVFSNILVCGIGFHFDNAITAHKLILEGEVRFYNWATLDEVIYGCRAKVLKYTKEYGIGEDIVEALIGQVRTVVAKQTKYCYEYNGKKYYHIGVLAIDAGALGIDIASNGVIDKTNINPSCNYSQVDIEGSVNLAVTNAYFKMKILSLTASDAFIKPGESYDNSVLSAIKQPSRF